MVVSPYPTLFSCGQTQHMRGHLYEVRGQTHHMRGHCYEIRGKVKYTVQKMKTEGARWNETKEGLDDSFPKQLYTEFPVTGSCICHQRKIGLL